MQGNKGWLIAALVVLGGISLLIVLRTTGAVGGKNQPTKEVMQNPIDSLEMTTLPLKTWLELGYNEKGLYKHPDTGNYSMAQPMTCAACKETIPQYEVPPDADEGALRKIMAEYKCPRCGKRAIARGNY